jgi:hypothetical protein
MEPTALPAAYSAATGMGSAATTATNGGWTALVSALVVGSRPRCTIGGGRDRWGEPAGTRGQN